MRYLPMFLTVEGRNCAIVGGGAVAFHKARLLWEAKAALTVISPELVPSLQAMTDRGAARHVARVYQQGDLQGYFLAVIATDDPQIQAAAAKEAHERGILVNVVDRPDLCSFVMPALHCAEDIIVAVSTSGTCPGFAAALRDRLAALVYPEYATALRLAQALRRRWLARGVPAADRRRRIERILTEDFLDPLRRRDWDAVQRVLGEIEGEPVSLVDLGMTDLL